MIGPDDKSHLMTSQVESPRVATYIAASCSAWLNPMRYRLGSKHKHLVRHSWANDAILARRICEEHEGKINIAVWDENPGLQSIHYGTMCKQMCYCDGLDLNLQIYEHRRTRSATLRQTPMPAHPAAFGQCRHTEGSQSEIQARKGSVWECCQCSPRTNPDMQLLQSVDTTSSPHRWDMLSTSKSWEAC